jgi:hypothetical protein
VDEETSFLDFVLRGAGSWIVFSSERKDAFRFCPGNYWTGFVTAGSFVGDRNVRGVQYFEEQFLLSAYTGDFAGDRRERGSVVWNLVRIGKPAEENSTWNARLVRAVIRAQI